jgi:pimeloyl-ACP methyl ester carboxylesterase
MTTFVLVHGAMHGGWCWRDVRAGLVRAGHVVHAPTLTGQGDRRHLLTPDVGVETHVADLVELLAFEDLRDVTLVLHSYAGVLAGPVVERSSSRVATVVHLGAFLVEPGECLLDVEPPETAARYRELVERDGEGWRLPATDAFLDQWGVTDPVAKAWVAPRLTAFPFRCQTDPVRFDPSALAAIRQVYVRHTDPPLPSLDASFARAVAAGWETHDVATGHDVMIAAPDRLTDLLIEITSR